MWILYAQLVASHLTNTSRQNSNRELPQAQLLFFMVPDKTN